MKSKYVYLVLLLALPFGCSEIGDEIPSAQVSSEMLATRQSGSAMAYVHSLVVDVREDQIATSVTQILDACKSDRANNCTVLESEVSSGAYPTGSIRVRINPQGVEALLNLTASLGIVDSQRMEAEDLTEVIADTESRLAMLLSFRENLQSLELQASEDIDSLIKISSEMTRIQPEIEQLTGEAAYQRQRTETDIVNIRFVARGQVGFWSPISSSLSDFRVNLSEGIASAISGIAYVVPWLLVILPIILLLRYILRRRKVT